MLRYRWTVVAAVVMAFISATSLGAGILGLVPVLDNIIGKHRQTLPDMAAQFNRSLAAHASWLGWQVPQAWIDRLPGSPFAAVLWVVIALGVLTAIGATANFLHAYLSLTVSTRAIAEIRRSAFLRVLHAPLKTVVQGQASDIVSRIVSDTNMMMRGFQALTDKTVAQITKGAASLAAAFVINWKLSAITLLIAPVLALIIRKLGKRVRRASRSAMRGRATLLGVASEVLHGFRVVKVYANERGEIGRFTRANRDRIQRSASCRLAGSGAPREAGVSPPRFISAKRVTFQSLLAKLREASTVAEVSDLRS